jgi:hypothetical protein
MKKLLLLAAVGALVACSENPTQPNNLNLPGPKVTVLSPGGVNLLACFSGTVDAGGYGGTCTLSSDHKKAVLANTSGLPAGDYSGVYSFDGTVYGEFLTNITELSYTYKSMNSPALIPQLGNLSYNIPIDTNGDGLTEFFAFVDAANCGVKSGATVNIVTAPACGIVAGSPGTLYSNWPAFIAAYPNATVSLTDNYIFIVAERTGSEPSATWTISNVKFGKTGLVCFDGPRDNTIYGGLCTLGSTFKSATLNNDGTDAGNDGDYSGFYSKETQAYGLFLTNIHDLWYKYSGPVPQLGNLSYNIPIDIDGGTYDFFAFVDAVNCRGVANSAGVYTVNITKDVACGIVAEGTLYANWAAFAAHYPNGRIANDLANNAYMFVIAERTPTEPVALWTIYDVKWGAKGK